MNRQQRRALQREAAKATVRVKKDLALINAVGQMQGHNPVHLTKKPPVVMRVREFLKRIRGAA